MTNHQDRLKLEEAGQLLRLVSQAGVFKPMHLRVKRYLTIILTVLGCLLLMMVGIYFKYAPRHPVTELEIVTARIPLGIPAAEAVTLMGTPPDSISQTRDKLLNSMTMLSADNSRSAKHDGTQLYTLRTWGRGDRHAIIAIDQSGKVAGHWTWSDYPPNSTSQFNLNHVTRSIYRLWRALVD